jgi:hypothetical protein
VYQKVCGKWGVCDFNYLQVREMFVVRGVLLMFPGNA